MHRSSLSVLSAASTSAASATTATTAFFAAFTSAAVAVVVAAALALPAAAQDIPKRKSGLWEINMDSAGSRGKTGRMAMITQCVDSARDDMGRQMGQEMAKEHKCSQTNMQKTSGGISFDSTCEFNGTKMKSKTAITGDFTSSYKVEIHTSYDPPIAGRSEGTTSMEAKYLGACMSGQRPGDMTMPGGMVMNIYEMMDAKKK
jgi:hypothetical protein